ncbi:uncharacterized protein LOC133183993 [Saccostrea echinata]|uniref:uncharacterized protein LOC133183993 n=1 Tax=Saccostrea echinata TaxID=191078 RepID=UPI002A80BBF1|nr:uncharacterized protein LOC133183993 [Saccostrea echinata]
MKLKNVWFWSPSTEIDSYLPCLQANCEDVTGSVYSYQQICVRVNNAAWFPAFSVTENQNKIAGKQALLQGSLLESCGPQCNKSMEREKISAQGSTCLYSKKECTYARIIWTADWPW